MLTGDLAAVGQSALAGSGLAGQRRGPRLAKAASSSAAASATRPGRQQRAAATSAAIAGVALRLRR